MKTYSIVWTESIARTTSIRAETEEEARNKLIEQVGYGFCKILSAKEQERELFILARTNKKSGETTYYSSRAGLLWIRDRHQASANSFHLWSDSFIQELVDRHPNCHLALEKI